MAQHCKIFYFFWIDIIVDVTKSKWLPTVFLLQLRRTAQHYSCVADIVYYNVQKWTNGTQLMSDGTCVYQDIHQVCWVFTNGGNREHIS